MEKWQDPSLSLGQRCLAFAENEMKNGVKEDKPNSFTSTRIKEYLAICKRRGTEKHLGLTSGNWCAAAVSFCLKNSLFEYEEVPHGFRAGAIEIESDLKDNKLWRPVQLARQGLFKPEPGDIVIFNRSNPNNPESAWWRHIGFYHSGDDKGNFKLISGNNGGCWKIDSHKYSSSKLLGFGEYSDIIWRPQIINTTDIPLEVSDIDNVTPLNDSGPTPKLSILESILEIFRDIFK